MARYTVEQLIQIAREGSKFYGELYSKLPKSVKAIDTVPVLEQEEFWKANTLDDNRILTGPMLDGVVFKSGGTTGNPKFSVFSKEEWKHFCEAFGRGISRNALATGDRVVNLFYVGQLYGSFLFINKSFEEAPLGVLQLPVAGSTAQDETARIIHDFKANVLAGVPTTILNLAEHLKGPGAPKIEKIYFGGEPMLPDQRERLSEIFPGVKCLSIGYASTDAGALGFADTSCAPNEHRVFDQDTIFEIIDDDTRTPIHEPGREGVIVVTNLTRTLMPIIRYPVGDRGMWLDPKGTRERKFRLMGRSEEAARIGLVKLYVQDVRDAIEPFRQQLALLDFQLIVTHHDRLDGLVVRLATGQASVDQATRTADARELIAAIHRARPLYEEFVRDHKVHPIQIEWVRSGELEVNARTGKMKRVIDRRFST